MLLNAPIPMLVTFEGIVTVFKLLHKLKAKLPMVATLEGMVTEIKLEQL